MTTKLFYDAEDIMEIMRIKKSSAYRLIKELNEELNDMGILTQGGVVRADYFRESLYVTSKPVTKWWQAHFYSF